MEDKMIEIHDHAEFETFKRRLNNLEGFIDYHIPGRVNSAKIEEMAATTQAKSDVALLWEIIDRLNDEVRSLTEKNNELNERCENQAIRNAILEKALETNKESAVHALAYKK
jgi:hypothetical protein